MQKRIKKKDDKKKTLALLAFFAPYPITTVLISCLLVINSKTTVISISKKVNLRRPNKFRLKTLIKKEYYFIYKK